MYKLQEIKTVVTKCDLHYHIIPWKMGLTEVKFCCM